MDSKKFGRYEIHGKLGHGAMGVVYKAFDPLLERSLAIKVMSSGTDEEAVQRFFREARATAGLRHPNIVAVYDIGEENRQPYIAIEYLDGQDLGQFLKQDLFIPFAWKIRLIIKICRGLHHAHDQGVIHRDIKPSNIRITRAGEAKIVDFGVAKLKSSEMTATGMVVGTPSYMSPQQVRGVKELDGRSDLFSAGVLLFELIAGRKPFAAPELHAVMFQICNAPHPSLTEILPGCSEELAAIVDRALAKEIEDRFQSGEEMADALEQFLGQLNDACSSLQEAFDEKVEQLQQRCRQLEEESLTEFVPDRLQQVPAPAMDPDRTILQDFGLFEAAGQQGVDYGEMLHRCAALNRQLEDLEKARKEFGEILQWISRSREEYESGLWATCLASLEAILSKQPEFAPALQLKKECQARLQEQRLEKQKKSRIDDLLKQSRLARQSNRPDEGLQSAEALLKLEPEHSEAAAIQQWARQALERQADLEKYLAQAQARSEAGDHQGCLDAVRSGLELDPDHQQLGRLKEHSRQMLEQASRAKKLLKQARSQFEAGSLQACLKTVRKGLEHVPDEKALKQLETQARSKLQRREQISELLEKAQAEYGQGQFSQALQTIQSLLDLDPSHEQARQLSEKARRALDVQEQLGLLIDEARSQLDSKRPQECLKTVRRGLKLESGSEQLKELNRQAEALLEKLSQADQALALARQEAESEGFRSALKHLAQALSLNPDLQEAHSLQGEVKEALAVQERVEELLAQARRHEASGDLQAAHSDAEEGLLHKPGHPDLTELLKRVEEGLSLQEKVRNLIAKAERQLKGEDYAAVLQSVQGLSRLQPEHPRLKDLQDEADKGLKRIERGRESLASALAEAKKGDWEACLQSATQGLEALPEHAQLQELKDEAERELKQRRTVAEGLEEARRLLAKDDFEGVLEQAGLLLQMDAGNAEALQMRSQAQKGQKRRQKVEKLVADARLKMDEGQPDAALRAARQGLKLHPDHSELSSLADQAKQLVAHQREVAKLLKQAEAALEKKGLEKAASVFGRLEKLAADDPQVQELGERLRLEQAEASLLQARQLEKEEELQPALQAAQRALQLAPQHEEAKQLHQRVEHRLAQIKYEEERAARIRKGVLEARMALKNGRLGVAHKAIEQVLKLDPELADARQLHKQVQSAMQQRRTMLGRGGLATAAALTLVAAVYLLWPTDQAPSTATPWISFQLQAGDTLQSAADRLGVDADQLINSNGLEDPQQVFPGQVLHTSLADGDKGTLILNISPWASVDSLLNEDGVQVLQGPGHTPLRIDLTPGRYTVKASNAELGGDLEFEVSVTAGQVMHEFRQWSHIDLGNEVGKLFQTR